MTTPFLSLEEMDMVFPIERDWLFEKLLGKLNAHRNLFLTADRGWGIREYVKELGFQLTEKNPDIQICYMDMKPAHSPALFLELFAAALSQRFPAIKTRVEIDSSKMEILSLPALIAQKFEIRVAVFLANTQLFLRFRDTIPFLKMLKLLLMNQKNCIFCFYGINNPYFGDLIHYPGPLSGLGQPFELRHNPLNHRSAIIRKLFHDHNKSIGFNASNQMSYMVDNHPGYLKLLAWHALIRTRDTCTTSIVEKALIDLIHHFDLRFYMTVKNLTSKQINLLKALVQGNQKLYSKALRDEYQLGTTSNIARIKQSLERKEIIITRSKESVFVDPIFREWLRRRYFSEK